MDRVEGALLRAGRCVRARPLHGKEWRWVGSRVVISDPSTLLIANFKICGRLPGTGSMRECAFHHGFIEAVISNTVGERVRPRQDARLGLGAEGSSPR
jgi:hypothetical protein